MVPSGSINIAPTEYLFETTTPIELPKEKKKRSCFSIVICIVLVVFVIMWGAFVYIIIHKVDSNSDD